MNTKDLKKLKALLKDKSPAEKTEILVALRKDNKITVAQLRSLLGFPKLTKS